jgi:hypothetical protein
MFDASNKMVDSRALIQMRERFVALSAGRPFVGRI